MDVEDLYGSIQIPCQWIDSHEISKSMQNRPNLQYTRKYWEQDFGRDSKKQLMLWGCSLAPSKWFPDITKGSTVTNIQSPSIAHHSLYNLWPLPNRTVKIRNKYIYIYKENTKKQTRKEDATCFLALPLMLVAKGTHILQDLDTGTDPSRYKGRHPAVSVGCCHCIPQRMGMEDWYDRGKVLMQLWYDEPNEDIMQFL